jgi:hypothetical protein
VLRPPITHPLHIGRPAEVVAIACLAQPATLTGRLAGTPTLGFAAVSLVVRVARVGMEQFSAVQALAPSSAFHLGHPPSYPKHGQYQRVPPPQDDAEEDSEQAANAEEEEKENEKRREKNTEKKIFSTCSSRLLGYIFSSALTFIANLTFESLLAL